jgi:hypothetical protein
LRRRLSADSIQSLLANHVHVAGESCPSLKSKRVSPHVLRHSAAMELLQAGVDCSVEAIWTAATPVDAHPYLATNGVPSHSLRQGDDGAPMPLLEAAHESPDLARVAGNLAEIPDFARPARIRQRHRVPCFGNVHADENHAILLHGSPSCAEARLAECEQPSQAQ